MKRIKPYPSIKLGLTIIILSLFNIIILFHNGQMTINYYNDLPFHLSRAMSLENITTSPTNFYFFNSFGIPMGLFYPWLTLYPFYFINHFLNQPVLSFYLFFYLVTIGTCLIAYYSAKKITHSPKVSFLFMLFYTFSFYRISDIYNRHAIGEAIAITFFPLAFYGLYSSLYKKNKNWIALTLGMSLILYTHFLSSLLMGIFLFIFLIINITKISKQSFFSLIKAIVATVLLTLPILFGLLSMKCHNAIALPTIYPLSQTALTLKEFFQATFTNTLVRNQMGFGCIDFILAIFCLLTLKKQNRLEKQLTLLGLFFLLITTTIFPWQWFQNTPLVMVQFPWRFLSISSLCFTFVASSQLASIIKKKGMMLTTFIVITVHIITIAWQPKTEVLTNKTLNEVVSSPTYHHVGRYDYAPYKIKKMDNQSFFNKKEIKIDKQKEKVNPIISNDGTSISYILFSEQTQVIELPVFYYSIQQTFVNGQQINTKEGPHGGIDIPLNRGKNDITITPSYPPFYKITIIIVLIVAFLLFFWQIKKMISKKLG